MIDWYQAIRCCLVLFTRDRYREDVSTLSRSSGATKNPSSYNYKPRNCKPSPILISCMCTIEQKSCCGCANYWLLTARAARSTSLRWWDLRLYRIPFPSFGIVFVLCEYGYQGYWVFGPERYGDHLVGCDTVPTPWCGDVLCGDY
jgi:hypothetical protein